MEARNEVPDTAGAAAARLTLRLLASCSAGQGGAFVFGGDSAQMDLTAAATRLESVIKPVALGAELSGVGEVVVRVRPIAYGSDADKLIRYRIGQLEHRAGVGGLFPDIAFRLPTRPCILAVTQCGNELLSYSAWGQWVRSYLIEVPFVSVCRLLSKAERIGQAIVAVDMGPVSILTGGEVRDNGA